MSTNRFDIDPEFCYDVESSLYALDTVKHQYIQHIIDTVQQLHNVNLLEYYEKYFGHEFILDDEDHSIQEEIPMEPLITNNKLEVPRRKEIYLYDILDDTYLPDVPIFAPNGVETYVDECEMDFDDAETALEEFPSVSTISTQNGRDVDNKVIKCIEGGNGQEGFIARLPTFNYQTRLVPLVTFVIRNSRDVGLKRSRKDYLQMYHHLKEGNDYFSVDMTRTIRVMLTHSHSVAAQLLLDFENSIYKRVFNEYAVVTCRTQNTANKYLLMLGNAIVQGEVEFLQHEEPPGRKKKKTSLVSDLSDGDQELHNPDDMECSNVVSQTPHPPANNDVTQGVDNISLNENDIIHTRHHQLMSQGGNVPMVGSETSTESSDDDFHPDAYSLFDQCFNE